MNCRDMDGPLNDFVDGALDDRARREVESHLEACPACRRQVASLRRLLALASALPRSLEPRRDLWPGIERSIHEAEPVPYEPRAGRAAPVRRARPVIALAAAAAILVLASAAAIVFLNGVPGRIPVPPAGTARQAAAQPGMPADVAAARAEYERASRILLETLRRRGDLPEEARSAIERNLRVIDRAIDDSVKALERDPFDAGLSRRVSATCRKKLELLREAARLSAPVS